MDDESGVGEALNDSSCQTLAPTTGGGLRYIYFSKWNGIQIQAEKKNPSALVESAVQPYTAR